MFRKKFEPISWPDILFSKSGLVTVELTGATVNR